MNRSPHALRWLAPGLLLIVIAAVVAVVSPTVADAQDNSPASLALAVSPDDPNQPFRTIAVAVDVGDSGLAALGATIHFDPDLILGGSCSVSEVGACNVTDDGRILMSVFSLSNLRSNDQLLTVNFEPAPDASGTTTFTVTATTAVTNQGVPIEAISGDSIDVELSPSTFGSLTGTVLAAETATALFDIDVCVVSDATGIETCTTTSGLGNWRIDDLETGTYGVLATDTTAVYSTTIESGFVTEDDVSLVADIAMAYFVAPVEDNTVATADQDPSDQGLTSQEDTSEISSIEVPVATAPLVLVYGASISGRITSIETDSAIVAAQVCATQPLVLHQSCATADANGEFSLSGLSTGNYWVEVVDPLGQFEQVRPKLVGVVGDDIERAGVIITLTAISE